MRVLSIQSDGPGFEREFFDKAFDDVNPCFRCFNTHRLKEAIAVVKKIQPDLDWNPTKPKTPLSESIFRRVASKLPTRVASLYLFSAIGTELDLYWGIDGWFEFGDRFVTFDLTSGVFKKHFKANYVLSRDHFLRNKHFGIASSIARRLQPL
jgi:hypothetical protein